MDTIVVGAGLAGLVAARRLAAAGQRVVVLDRAAPGGRARSTTRDGFVWNLGPHAVYLRGRGLEVLRGLGIDPPGGRAAAKADGWWRGRVEPIPSDPWALVSSPLLTGSRAGLIPWLLAPARGSVADWTASLPGPARDLVLGLVRVATYANLPERLDAAVARRQVIAAVTGGVRYVDGGWQTIVDRLVDGLDVRRAHVTAVRPGAVETDAGALRADHVVLAVPAGVERALVGEGPEVAEAAAATLCLAMRRLPIPERRVVLGLDEPWYLSDHGAVARLAPPGQTVVHVARYLAEGEVGSREALEGWMDAVQPGWRAEVVAARFSPRLVVAGVPVVDRPRPGIAVAPGLWRAGDHVGDGMLADAAIGSGADVADAIAGALVAAA